MLLSSNRLSGKSLHWDGLNLGVNRRIAVLAVITTTFVGIGCGAIIQAPDGWTEAETPPDGTLAVFYNPEPDFYDELAFTAKITVVAEKASDLTLEEYVASSKQVISNLLPDSDAATSLTELGGQPAFFIDSTFHQGLLPLRARQLCVERDGTVYVLTAMALATHWNNYIETFERSLLSLKP